MPYCANCGSFTPDVSYAPCPSCGNPTNGAPRPMPIAPARSRGGKLVLLAVALVLAIPFMGIFAAIAIPNFLTAMQRSRQKRTMADVRTLATKVEAYGTQHNRYPADLAAVGAAGLIDGWGRPYWYSCRPAPRCTSYAIVSMAKDGVLEKEEISGYTEGQTTNFDCDIVFIDGKFVQYPQGAPAE